MSREASSRAELVAALLQAGRQLSAATIMFHQTVADCLGLNATDHKCLDLLATAGPLTAGELADRTGLTTGAITSAIDRLERAGYARRVDDPRDRRRVIVRPVARRCRRIGRLFEHLGAAVAELGARYRDEQLVTILDFLAESQRVLHESTQRLRPQAEKGAGRKAGPNRRHQSSD